MKRHFLLIPFIIILFGIDNIYAQKVLLPTPQKIQWGKSRIILSDPVLVVSPELFYREKTAIEQFIGFLKTTSGLTANTAFQASEMKGQLIVLNSVQQGPGVPQKNEKTGIQSREAYSLKASGSRIEISAQNDAGIFYALQTLKQLVTREGDIFFIPEVSIEDFPAFPYRGVMMDFSHGGLLTEAEIKRQIDFLAGWKMNQYYFYNEVSIEMKGYSLMNYNACYSQEQVRRIIEYGKERHIDVIPFVYFYSHLHEFLRMEKYNKLGITKYGHDLYPVVPEVQTVLKDWIRQYADLFPGPFIHIGFDETSETERLTIEDPSINPRKLYLQQLEFVMQTLRQYGKSVMIWTDITSTYPDIMSEFPRDIIPVIWEYQDKPDAFPKWFKPVKKEKMPFFVQSAVDSWGNVYPASEYTFDNIDLCLKACRDEKAIGYITSVWTDAVQPLLRNTWLFMSYGTIGAWQSEPVNRTTFVDDYCRIMYPGISDEMSNGFKQIAVAESYLSECLGRHTLSKMWADPFSEKNLKNTNEHLSDFKNSRLAAESAQECFFKALQKKTADSSFIRTLLVNCRQEDYAAMRLIWAKTIIERWNWLYDIKAEGKKDGLKFYAVNNSCHGLTVDMMDLCTEIKEEYRKAWLEENMPYRSGTILGRFDSEYMLWRKLYMSIDEVRIGNNADKSAVRFEDLFLKK